MEERKLHEHWLSIDKSSGQEIGFFFKGRIIGIFVTAALSNEGSLNYIALNCTTILYIWCMPICLESPFIFFLILSHLTSLLDHFIFCVPFICFFVQLGGSYLQ